MENKKKNMRPAVAHLSSGDMPDKARISGIVEILSQSPTARGLLKQAHENGYRIVLNGLAGHSNSVAGMHSNKSRMIVLHPGHSDDECVGFLARELAMAAAYGEGTSQRVHLRPLDLIHQTEMARAHGAAMAFQVAHELKEGHMGGFHTDGVWDSLEKANPGLAETFSSSLKEDALAATDGKAADAVFRAAIADTRAREVTEDNVMTNLLDGFVREGNIPIFFRQPLDVDAWVGKLTLNGKPYIEDVESLKNPEAMAVSQLTADKIHFFESEHLPDVTPQEISVRVENNSGGGFLSGIRNMLSGIFNGAEEKDTPAQKPKPKLTL